MGLTKAIRLFLGRCWHCGSKNTAKWDDSHLKTCSYGHTGKLCKDCNMITLDKW